MPPKPSDVTIPLEYAPPDERRPSPLVFWILYGTCGFVSALVTDPIVNGLSGTNSDGGCLVIGLMSLIPIAIAVGVARAVIGRRMKMAAWLGSAVGLVGPPVALGTLIAFRVI